MTDPHNLQRFVDAQSGTYAQICEELRHGRKTSHWIWFIFPQIRGLGRSETAERYAIASLDEAKSYLQHPVLGFRLRECCELLLKIEERSISEIMGYPDDLKLKSSMTLFSEATSENALFLAVLRKYFSAELDSATLRIVEQ